MYERFSNSFAWRRLPSDKRRAFSRTGRAEIPRYFRGDFAGAVFVCEVVIVVGVIVNEVFDKFAGRVAPTRSSPIFVVILTTLNGAKNQPSTPWRKLRVNRLAEVIDIGNVFRLLRRRERANFAWLSSLIFQEWTTRTQI